MSDVKQSVPQFITVEDAIKMDGEQTIALQFEHLNAMRNKLSNAKHFVKAEGCTFIDSDGNKHLDMIGAVGVCTVGNNNPFVWEKLKLCFDTRQHMMGVIGYHSVTAAFAHNMALLSPGGQLTKMGTATGGAEAIEGMLKLVKIGTRTKPNKTHMLSCTGSFHGKTQGAIALGKDKWRMWQEPTLPNCDQVPFGDAEALDKALATGKYKAFVVEPIQGEGGIIVPPAGYLKKCRELCDKYDTILVLDEIQCGFGRTGRMWCCQHEDVVPDVLVFAKGSSGALIPSGGYLAKKELYEAAYGSPESCFHHTATYQENTLTAAAGLATLQFLIENDLFKAAETKGNYLMGELKKIQDKYPGIIKEIRGRGLMIGMEFNAMPENLSKYGSFYSEPVSEQLLNQERVQVLVTINNPSTYRFLPPLIINQEEMDMAIAAFDRCCASASQLK